MKIVFISITVLFLLNSTVYADNLRLPVDELVASRMIEKLNKESVKKLLEDFGMLSPELLATKVHTFYLIPMIKELTDQDLISGDKIESGFYKAGVIAGLLLYMSQNCKRLKIDPHLVNRIAEFWLESPVGKLDVPVFLALNYVLNKTGSKEDKEKSVREILKICADKNEEYAELAMRLLADCDIPNEVKSKVSADIVKLYTNNTYLYYENIPPVLKKTGLSKEVKKNLTEGKILEDLIGYVNVHKIATIEMLAEFALKDNSIIRAVKEAYLKSYSADKRLRVILLESGDANVLKDFKNFGYYKSCKEKDAQKAVTYALSCLNKNPKGEDSPFYIYFVAELLRSRIDLKLEENIHEFVKYLNNVSADRYEEKYSKDVHLFASRALMVVGTKLYSNFKKETLDTITQFLNNPFTDAQDFTFRAVEGIGVHDNILLSQLIGRFNSLSRENPAYHKFVIGKLLSGKTFARKDSAITELFKVHAGALSSLFRFNDNAYDLLKNL
ncbi:MAG: hypothetical protein KKD11_06150 [Candidatus Omnitrophica bacterium]|nr:hypothetical protein [Candidatus Omnitrophota bacterium]